MSSLDFLNRLKTYTAVEWLNESYSRVKDSNFLTRSTLNLAESTLTTGVNLVARPLMYRFKNQITYVDTMACNQLNRLENVSAMVVNAPRTINQVTKASLTSVKTAVGRKYHSTWDVCQRSISFIITGLFISKLINRLQYSIDRTLGYRYNQLKDTDRLMSFAYLDLLQRNRRNLKDTEQNQVPLLYRFAFLAGLLFNLAKLKTKEGKAHLVNMLRFKFQYLQALADVYQSCKRSILTRLNGKYIETKAKADIYWKYIVVLVKQYTVQDGRSLQNVQSSEERIKIIIRRMLGNAMTIVHGLNVNLQRVIYVFLSIKNWLTVNYLQFLSLNKLLGRSHKQIEAIVNKLMSSKCTMVTWLVPNLSVFGILHEHESENNNHRNIHHDDDDDEDDADDNHSNRTNFHSSPESIRRRFNDEFENDPDHYQSCSTSPSNQTSQCKTTNLDSSFNNYISDSNESNYPLTDE